MNLVTKQSACVLHCRKPGPFVCGHVKFPQETAQLGFKNNEPYILYFTERIDLMKRLGIPTAPGVVPAPGFCQSKKKKRAAHRDAYRVSNKTQIMLSSEYVFSEFGELQKRLSVKF